MKYCTPYLARYGNAKKVIQGACSFGFENWTLDKTGTTINNVRAVTWSVVYDYPNEYYIKSCEYRSVCSNDSYTSC